MTSDDDHAVRKIREQIPESCGYLDYAASSIVLPQQAIEIARVLSRPMSNPHSDHPLAMRGAQALAEARALILQHFSVTAATHAVVLVRSATEALSLLAHAFPFSPRAPFVHQMECHTSVLGIRGVAQAAGAAVVPVLEGTVAATPPEWDDADQEIDADESIRRIPRDCDSCMLAVPAECNFSGFRHDLHALRGLKQRVAAAAGCGARRCFFVLDAAKWAASSSLPLHRLQHVDAVCFSAYKLLGAPTGLGALVIRNDAAWAVAGKTFFGGGTLAGGAASEPLSLVSPDLSRRLQDGTPPFVEAAMLGAGFRALAAIGGARGASRRARALAASAAARLSALRHPQTGNPATSPPRPLVRLLGRQWQGLACEAGGGGAPAGPVSSPSGARSAPLSASAGTIVAFVVHDSAGRPVPSADVAQAAAACGVALRHGCFCNLGACETHLGLTPAVARRLAALGRRCGDDWSVADGRHVAAVRASFGLLSTEEDVARLERVVWRAAVESAPAPLPPPPRAGTDARLYLRSIHVYPVKSCGAVDAAAWPLRPSGLLFDRAWAVVGLDGTALRQTAAPGLRAVAVRWDAARRHVVLSTPAAAAALRIVPSAADAAAAAACEAVPEASEGRGSAVGSAQGVPLTSAPDVIVRCEEPGAWAPAVAAMCGPSACSTARLCCLPEVADWVSAAAGTPATLAMRDDGPGGGGVGGGASFANVSPLLVLHDDSLRALRRLAAARAGGIAHAARITAPAFRPNLVVGTDGGLCPGAEQRWAALRLAGAEQSGWLAAAGPCRRCAMVNHDPVSGEAAPETLVSVHRFGRQERGRSVGIVFGTLFESVDGAIARVGTVMEEQMRDDTARD